MTRTIAIESEDASAVIAAVRGVGLDGHVNTSYPRGLAALIDDGPARYAVIDVGTNSVKFHVGERDAGGRWRTIVDRAEMTRLGEDLDVNNGISTEPLDRTVTAIAGMVEEAGRNGVRAIAAVGTAGLRIARNRDDVVAAIRARTGVTVEVIPGEEEGRLAYLAVQAELGVADGSLVVFDTGGGSSAVHLRARPARRRAVQRARRRGSLHRALRARRRGGARGAGRCPRGDLRRPVPHRWPPAAGCAGGDGRRGDQPHGGEARAGHLRPRRGPGRGPGPGRDRPPDRALPVARRRRSPRDRRPPAQARRRHPGRRMHRPDGHGQAGPADS